MVKAIMAMVSKYSHAAREATTNREFIPNADSKAATRKLEDIACKYDRGDRGDDFSRYGFRVRRSQHTHAAARRPPHMLLSCLFSLQSILYSIRQQAAAKPPTMSQEEWDAEYGTDDTPKRSENNIPLLPTPVIGFEMLGQRMKYADKVVTDTLAAVEVRACTDAPMQLCLNVFAHFLRVCQRLTSAVRPCLFLQIEINRAKELETDCAKSKAKLAVAKETAQRQRSRLLLVAQKVDMLLLLGKPSAAEEVRLAAEMAALHEKLARSASLVQRVGELQRRVSEREAARLLPSSSSAAVAAAAAAAAGPLVDLSIPRNYEMVKDRLMQVHEQVDRMLSVLDKDKRHVGVAGDKLQQSLRIVDAAAAATRTRGTR